MSSFLHALAVFGHVLQTAQDHQNNHGQQCCEDGTQQVVAAAAVLAADVHQHGNHVADHIHPRDGGREEETCSDGRGKRACGCGYDTRHFTLYGEKRLQAWEILSLSDNEGVWEFRE